MTCILLYKHNEYKSSNTQIIITFLNWILYNLNLPQHRRKSLTKINYNQGTFSAYSPFMLIFTGKNYNSSS
jgi:hypothetical protein